MFQYCACCVCKNPPYASFSLWDDCLQSEMASWGGIETTCGLLCKHKKMAKEASFIVAGMKMLQSPHLSKKRLLLDTQKMALLSSQASLEPHWHMHIKTFTAEINPRDSLEDLNPTTITSWSTYYWVFCICAVGQYTKNEPGLNCKRLWLKVKWATEILL